MFGVFPAKERSFFSCTRIILCSKTANVSLDSKLMISSKFIDLLETPQPSWFFEPSEGITSLLFSIVYVESLRTGYSPQLCKPLLCTIWRFELQADAFGFYPNVSETQPSSLLNFAAGSYWIVWSLSSPTCLVLSLDFEASIFGMTVDICQFHSIAQSRLAQKR